MATGQPGYLQQFLIRSLKDVLRGFKAVYQALAQKISDARHTFKIKPRLNAVHNRNPDKPENA